MATQWQYYPYPKIVENTADWKLDEAGYRAVKKVRWAVTEKIHGANFNLVTDGSKVMTAKRKTYLVGQKDFFEHQHLLADLMPKVLRLHAKVRKLHPECSRTVLHGELFGGYYPHPEVAPDPNAEMVQSGVWYHPSICFSAFDIAWVGVDGIRSFLAHYTALKLLDDLGIFSCLPLMVGSLQQVLGFEVGFDSTLPEMLGMPVITPNKAEGIVIKPFDVGEIMIGDRCIRPTLKVKIDAFQEDNRYHQARKPQGQPPYTMTTHINDKKAPELPELLLRSASLMNTNRMDSAISKLGRRPAIKELVQELAADVWDSLSGDFDMQALDAGTRKKVCMALEQQAHKLVAASGLMTKTGKSKKRK